ncbi:hypothetical protein SKAU_G00290210 [Synaphobranchus kaupii]|uniref:Uncharacterized protein n=1 Tax=Synaphobranchus kaupii TaxID=118154 RepID=A0A9Q1ETP0_SYNKA|nr:hypothetical protein SKAU_G00290210 [Synaphobranchus kaupii]
MFPPKSSSHGRNVSSCRCHGARFRALQNRGKPFAFLGTSARRCPRAPRFHAKRSRLPIAASRFSVSYKCTWNESHYANVTCRSSTGHVT